MVVLGLAHPVVEPAFKARHWIEVLLELSERIGMRSDFNNVFNVICKLEKPYFLNPEEKYSWEEMSDRWLKSRFGDEHGIKWFKEHGVLKWPKKVEEIYPRPFIKGRIPVYLEHFIKAGEDIKKGYSRPRN